MKSISTINPAVAENMKCPTINAHAPFINLKVGVLLDHYVALCFSFAPSYSNMSGKIPNTE